MSPASVLANRKAKAVLASLKSGLLLHGTVRSHSMSGATAIAWIAIQIPVLGERQILIKDEPHLQPGQKVILQCVPDPSQPERYTFRLAGAPHPSTDGKH